MNRASSCNSAARFLHIFLCRGRCAIWQSRLQYLTSLHAVHAFKLSPPSSPHAAHLVIVVIDAMVHKNGCFCYGCSINHQNKKLHQILRCLNAMCAKVQILLMNVLIYKKASVDVQPKSCKPRLNNKEQEWRGKFSLFSTQAGFPPSTTLTFSMINR